MKKYLIGFIAGALFMVAGQSFAGTASFVGKKIESELPVTLNGETVDNAIIVQGKSFVPVRSLTVAMGGEVKAVGKSGIDLTNVDDVATKINILETQRAAYQKDIDSWVNGIKFNEQTIAEFKIRQDNARDPGSKQAYQHDIDAAQSTIDENKARIAELQAKIDTLNAEIDALKAQL